MKSTVEFIVSIFPYLCLIEYLRKKNQLFLNNSLFYLLLSFGVYITGMFHFTDPSTLYDWLYYKGNIFVENINVHPFSTGISKIGYFLNVILFIPFGFFLPILFKMKYPSLQTLIYGLFTSFWIECSQLFNTRISDVDDLVMNSLGTLIGLVLCLAGSHFLPRYKLPLSYLLWFLLVLYAGRFFLYIYVT